MTKTIDKKYKKQTQRVRGGLLRSNHGETSEAIYMNSGYVYKSAEEMDLHRNKFICCDDKTSNDI